MSESHEATPAPADQEAVETSTEITPQEQGTSDSFTDSPPQHGDELYPRYEQMQADYTRKTQAVAEQRRELEAYRDAAESWQRMQEDPDFQRQALEALGYEVPQDEEEEQVGYYEPEQALSDPRIDALMEAEQERSAQQVAAEIHDHIQTLAENAGVKLTQRQQASIFREAVDDGDPQPHRTQAIFEDFIDDVRAQRGEWEKDWLTSKRSASQVVQGGQEGSQRFDISDKDQRLKHMAAVMDAAAAAEEVA